MAASEDHMNVEDNGDEPELTMDDFLIHEQLGTGCRAKVFHCEHIASGGHYAMKVTRKVEIMNACEHEGIVGLAAAFETQEEIMLARDSMVGGDLFDLLIEKKRFSEDEARVITKKVVSALQYLHSNGIVHRDLKPENLLLGDARDCSTVKIADFGFAKYLRPDGTLITPCGTPGYVAPEIANAEAYEASVDMWSVGVILYTILAGFPPFYAEEDSDLLEKIAEGAFSFPDPWWSTVSDAAKDLVSHLIEKEPERRYTASQVLEHPWLDGATSMPNPLRRSASEASVSRMPQEDGNKSRMLHLINQAVAAQRHDTTNASVTENGLWQSRTGGQADTAQVEERQVDLAHSDPTQSPWLKTRKSSSLSKEAVVQ